MIFEKDNNKDNNIVLYLEFYIILQIYCFIRSEITIFLVDVKYYTQINIYEFSNYIIIMSFTRFYDDSARIKLQTDMSTFSGRYALDTPGQGTNLPFYEDPQMRLQYWGANLMTNTVNIESELRGITRVLTRRDNEEQNNYKTSATQTSQLSFPTLQPYVEESRASHPAWMYKDVEQTRWETPILNPLANLEKKFHENIQTRILEKDYFTPTIPMVSTTSENTETNSQYYLTGHSICMGGTKR